MIKKFLYCLAIFACTIFASNGQERYRDKTLSAQERAEDIVKRLTLEEKISLMIDVSQPVERLDIKPTTGGTRHCTVWAGRDWPLCFHNPLAWQPHSTATWYTMSFPQFRMKPAPKTHEALCRAATRDTKG